MENGPRNSPKHDSKSTEKDGIMQMNLYEFDIDFFKSWIKESAGVTSAKLYPISTHLHGMEKVVTDIKKYKDPPGTVCAGQDQTIEFFKYLRLATKHNSNDLYTFGDLHRALSQNNLGGDGDDLIAMVKIKIDNGKKDGLA